AFTDNAGVNPSRELAEIRTRARQFRLRRGEHVRSAVGCTVLRFSEDHLELGEPPLRALAKLALEAAPLGVGRLDHPTPGSVELLDLAPDICLQAGLRKPDPAPQRQRT